MAICPHFRSWNLRQGLFLSSGLGHKLPFTVTDSVPAQNSNVWIVGPIVGSICSILLALTCFWLIQRRRRKSSSPAVINNGADDKYKKPALHADHVASGRSIEVEGSYPESVPEMGANEVPAQEMLVSTTVAEMTERHA